MAENVARCKVCQYTDLRAITALLIIEKASGAIEIETNPSEFKVDQNCLVEVITTNEDHSICRNRYKDLFQIWDEFGYCALEKEVQSVLQIKDLSAEKMLIIYEILKEEFIEKVENKAKCSERYVEQASRNVISTFASFAKTDIIKQVVHATYTDFRKEVLDAIVISKKIEHYLPLVQVAKDNIIVISGERINILSLVYCVDALESDVTFVVLPEGDRYLWRGIPVKGSIHKVRKTLPNKYLKMGASKLKELVGAKSSCSIHPNGIGGVCDTLEDAIKFAKFAANHN